MVTFASKVPGRIFPIDVTPGHGYVVHRHGWVCGTPGITPSVALQQSFRGGLWGGEGFILQKLEGEGQAWIELSGEIDDLRARRRPVAPRPPRATSACSHDSVTFSVIRLPGIVNRYFGADGHHLVSLTGPGTIWLQSMPLPVLAHALVGVPRRQRLGARRRHRGRGRGSPRQRPRPSGLTAGHGASGTRHTATAAQGARSRGTARLRAPPGLTGPWRGSPPARRRRASPSPLRPGRRRRSP